MAIERRTRTARVRRSIARYGVAVAAPVTVAWPVGDRGGGRARTAATEPRHLARTTALCPGEPRSPGPAGGHTRAGKTAAG